ncbi:MAG: hypothetical protein H7Y17_09895 [Chlorobia bacterium]|nr:hypothetical protein [Fimbriimonadaceae bacterium]
MEFLEKGLLVNRCVGRVMTRLDGSRRSFGTGFMISPRLLLTNWHVLKTKEVAANSTVEFQHAPNMDVRQPTRRGYAAFEAQMKS